MMLSRTDSVYFQFNSKPLSIDSLLFVRTQNIHSIASTHQPIDRDRQKCLLRKKSANLYQNSAKYRQKFHESYG